MTSSIGLASIDIHASFEVATPFDTASSILEELASARASAMTDSEFASLSVLSIVAFLGNQLASFSPSFSFEKYISSHKCQALCIFDLVNCPAQTQIPLHCFS